MTAPGTSHPLVLVTALAAGLWACSAADNRGLGGGGTAVNAGGDAGDAPAGDAHGDQARETAPDLPACPAPLSACGTEQSSAASICVNLADDQTSCGACGRTCPVGRACQGGACACAAGQADCLGACVNLETDSGNCGACGTACPMGQLCSKSRCTVACDQGLTACGAGMRGSGDERHELRRLRQGLRDRADLSGRGVWLPRRPAAVRGSLREPAVRHAPLRRLRQALWHRRCLFTGPVRVRLRVQHLRRRVRRSVDQRPPLWLMRQRLLRRPALRGGRLHRRVRGEPDELRRHLRQPARTRRSTAVGAIAPVAWARPARTASAWSACPMNQTSCGGTCVDTREDGNHCGGCNRQCPGGMCRNSMCAGRPEMCPPGRNECNGACVNLANDPRNCGRCGNECPGGGGCLLGLCTGLPL